MPKASTLFQQGAYWQAIKQEFWLQNEKVCAVCGGEATQIDHIKSKLLFPEVAFDMDNLRPICWPCNRAKSDRYEGMDYSPTEIKERRRLSRLTLVKAVTGIDRSWEADTDIRALRLRAGLKQHEAAQLIHRTRDAWVALENATEPDPALVDLFELKVRKIVMARANLGL